MSASATCSARISSSPARSATVLATRDGSLAGVVWVDDGVVTAVESTGGLGNHVTIDHIVDGQLVTTTSAHMQSGSVMVSVGQAVRAGDQIGRVGNTGASTGPHLHFELRLGGTDPVDAYAWISARVG